MRRWMALAPLLLLAGCLARVESAVIPVREPRTALANSVDVFQREGFLVPTWEPGLVRTAWRFADRREGDEFLYFRYVVEQRDPDEAQIGYRIEVIRCAYVPREGEEWGKSGCQKMPPRVPLWAEDDYRRVEQILRAAVRPKKSRKPTK